MFVLQEKGPTEVLCAPTRSLQYTLSWILNGYRHSAYCLVGYFFFCFFSISCILYWFINSTELLTLHTDLASFSCNTSHCFTDYIFTTVFSPPQNVSYVKAGICLYCSTIPTQSTTPFLILGKCSINAKCMMVSFSSIWSRHFSIVSSS